MSDKAPPQPADTDRRRRARLRQVREQASLSARQRCRAFGRARDAESTRTAAVLAADMQAAVDAAAAALHTELAARAVVFGLGHDAAARAADAAAPGRALLVAEQCASLSAGRTRTVEARAALLDPVAATRLASAAEARRPRVVVANEAARARERAAGYTTSVDAAAREIVLPVGEHRRAQLRRPATDFRTTNFHRGVAHAAIRLETAPGPGGGRRGGGGSSTAKEAAVDAARKASERMKSRQVTARRNEEAARASCDKDHPAMPQEPETPQPQQARPSGFLGSSLFPSFDPPDALASDSGSESDADGRSVAPRARDAASAALTPLQTVSAFPSFPSFSFAAAQATPAEPTRSSKCATLPCRMSTSAVSD
ncbi:hypothetical protein HK405_003224 [Cladochytrium tenue]|nr:hypothetical protein HK405_003224 [Cladochytrium tenue]